MSTMIERVTQAARITPDQARAAIAAMREPTEEMSHAGWRTDSGISRVVWQAMIDKALNTDPVAD